MREKHILKIKKTKQAIENTNSKQRKHELIRHLRKLQKDLKIYDSYRRC